MAAQPAWRDRHTDIDPRQRDTHTLCAIYARTQPNCLCVCVCLCVCQLSRLVKYLSRNARRINQQQLQQRPVGPSARGEPFVRFGIRDWEDSTTAYAVSTARHGCIPRSNRALQLFDCFLCYTHTLILPSSSASSILLSSFISTFFSYASLHRLVLLFLLLRCSASSLQIFPFGHLQRGSFLTSVALHRTGTRDDSTLARSLHTGLSLTILPAAS